MNKPTVFVVSGGLGTSGGQLVGTVLAQFRTNDIPMTIVPQVRNVEQLEQLIAQASSTEGIVVHTLVNEALRRELVQLAKSLHMVEVDFVGPLLDQLTRRWGKRLMVSQVYAAIVLTRVSRVGKTPLSMHLSTMGWKVANVPIVKGINLPSTLFEIDHRRVIGLTIEPGQLVAYRRRRGHHLGIRTNLSYGAPAELVVALEFAREVFLRGKFAVMDMTDKPIEESADEIISRISRRMELSSD